MSSTGLESPPTESGEVIASLSADDLQLAARWVRLLGAVLGYAPVPAGDLVALREQLEEVTREMSGRDPDALEMVALLYGLGDKERYTVDEVARKLGYTRERIRRVEQEVIRRLRYPRCSRSIRAEPETYRPGRNHS